jgi:phosphoglycerate dehydrogenase-like enzyme
MSESPHIFFMASQQLQDRFFNEQAKCYAAKIGYEIRLNTLPGKVAVGEWVEQLVGVEALLTTWGSPRLDETVLLQNQTLKIVGHVGGSVAGIVSQALFERGVKVCTANTLMARTVAEWSLMMTMVGLRHLWSYAQFGAQFGAVDWTADWVRREGNLPPDEAVIGIWGYGDVAKAFIALLRPLHPRAIAVHDDFLTDEIAEAEGLQKVGLDELFASADVIHCQTGLTAANKGRVGAQQLAAIKEGGVLVNCGRAPLIDEQALIAALQERRFAAIMDVFEEEPLHDEHPYRMMENVIITPHCAGNGRDGRYLGLMLDEFDRFFRGEALETEVSLQRALAMTDSSLLRKR